MGTLIILDNGETETFGDEADIIDFTHIVSPYSDYDKEDLVLIREKIAKYPGTESYVQALDELINAKGN